jgi:hypothetical protein
MVFEIKTKGWLQSTIRVIKDPKNAERFLCIDGMHRVTAMQQLKKEDIRFKDTSLEILVYPEMNEFMQCALADSNYY